MDGWLIDELRRRAEEGGTFGTDDVLALVEAMAKIQRAAAVPPEFVVRVARDEREVDRWTATHPLLRTSATAEHPADALALASVELRRVLADHDWPVESWPSGRVERAVADAQASGHGETALSLRWALGELDRVAGELHDERLGARLRTAAASGHREARARLRAQNVARLEAAGVAPSRREWTSDGFGPAIDVDLPLPCLVLAMTVRGPDDVDGLQFGPDRRWHALSHEITPRPMRQYRVAVVTPLQLSAAGDLALRRSAPRVPTGRSVGTYCAFRDLLAEELPGVDVTDVSEELSSAWVPLPIEAIPQLCAGTPDADVDLDLLAERTVKHRRWLLFPRWELAYVTEHLGDSEW